MREEKKNRERKSEERKRKQEKSEERERERKGRERKREGVITVILSFEEVLTHSYHLSSFIQIL